MAWALWNWDLEAGILRRLVSKRSGHAGATAIGQQTRAEKRHVSEILLHSCTGHIWVISLRFMWAGQVAI